MPYKHLTIEERENLQLLFWQKKSIRYIAKQLNRNHSTISREINKNNPKERRVYTPRIAHQRALKNRSKRGREKRLKDDKLREYVVSHLKLGWSPEQIAKTAKNNADMSISHEAIYQYIYAQIYEGGYGPIKPGKEDLRPYLARRKKRRVRKGSRSSYRIEKGPLPSIETRPNEVNSRETAGHWEGDLIVSRQSKIKLKTINERTSGLVFIRKVQDGTAKESNKTVIRTLSRIPKKHLKTLTLDRGSENLGYEEVENILKMKCYFAHAYSSWERGSNENVNGLIRRFLPKKTDFNNITDEQIKTIEYLLNARPRKRLGWKTPYEVFYEKTGVALQC